mgnify:FL=1
MVIGKALKKGQYVIGFVGYLFISSIFFSNAKANPNSEKLEIKLDELNKELLAFRSFLSNTEASASEAEKLLRSSEKELNILVNRIEKKKKSIKNNKSTVKLLEKKRRMLVEKRDLQAKIVKEQIRLEYQRRDFDYLKFLLSQEEPVKLSRMNRYFQSLNNARLDQMNRLRVSIDQTKRVEQDLQEYVSEIATDIKQLALEQTSLQQKREEKKKIAREFQLEIEKTRQKIVNIEENKETLIDFLSEFRSKERKNEQSWNTEQFSEMKGKLEMPVDGKILHNFGDNRGTGELKWQGLFIEGERGSPVRSVYPGTVIFSDWFRGLGLLIIIKHGDGFMSLYAHNETLKKEAGDIVSPNDLIATIGNSGGQQKTGVYFEIRVQGKASNPKDWLAEKKVLKLESKRRS